MARIYPEAMQNVAMNNMTRQDSITTPPQQDFDTPAMEGSMQQFLSENLGQYVVIEFLIGTQTLTRKAGVLYAVGASVVTLYEEISQTFVTCDIFSVKFVTFYLPGRRPWLVSNPMFGQGTVPDQGWTTQGQTGMGQGGLGMPATGFAPPMDMTGVPDPGCIGGNCGGGATSPSWG